MHDTPFSSTDLKRAIDALETRCCTTCQQRNTFATLQTWGTIHCYFTSSPASYMHVLCLKKPACSCLSPYFSSFYGCPRFHLIGGNQNCCDQANACKDDHSDEGQGVGLVRRDECRDQHRAGNRYPQRGSQIRNAAR